MQVTYKITDELTLRSTIDDTQPLMFDCETIGLYGKIRIAQFYQRHFTDVLILENPSPYTLVAILSRVHTVGHNLHYDISCIQEALAKSSWMPDKFSCTFLLSRLFFYKEESFSLDNVIRYVLGYDPYEGKKKENQGSDWNVPVLSEEQLIYASKDVVYLHDVYDKVKVHEDDINYKLDILTLRYALDFQNNGMPVDEDKLNAKYVENATKIKELGLTINCNSYQQVRAYINSNLSDDKGLAVLISQGNERAKQVRDVRKLTKNNSFLTKFNTTLFNGCIFGKFKLSPRSGRLSSDDQNLQQIPRSLKGIFGVDKDGDTVVLFSDFAQIQLRNVCVVANDKTMEKLFREGNDLHNFVAQMIFGDSFTPDHRQICKTANFALLFGAGIAVFISILLTTTGYFMTEQEATTLKKKWLNLWVQISQWQTAGIRAWKRGDIGITPLGRRYTAKMLTDQLAMQIQGFEAEVAKLALHYMYPKMMELNKQIPSHLPKFMLRNFIHDCYLWTGPNEENLYKEACVIIASSMQTAWFEMCKTVAIKDLPMPTKVRVGFNWGEIEKGELDNGYIYEYSV